MEHIMDETIYVYNITVAERERDRIDRMVESIISSDNQIPVNWLTLVQLY